MGISHAERIHIDLFMRLSTVLGNGQLQWRRLRFIAKKLIMIMDHFHLPTSRTKLINISKLLY